MTDSEEKITPTIAQRFLKYVAFDTQSDENATETPSTSKQLVFAEFLKQELINEGLKDVELTPNGYLYAVLPANTSKPAPAIGFIAHYDTSPDCSGKSVRARIIHQYDGGDIRLSDTMITDTRTFAELLEHVGEDLIVTDGTTLLGADDKAGIAEIMEAVVYLRDHKEIVHGDIHIAFTPDEEIGHGARLFDIEGFGCEWAYTVDGGDLGGLEYENFNAAEARISITGIGVHPGYAKGKMVNASRLAAEFALSLPAAETPEETEGYQGFYHLTHIDGNVEQASLSYIIRDHDAHTFERRKDTIKKLAVALNERYPAARVNAIVTDQYRNMKEQITPRMHIIDIAIQAMQQAGVAPRVSPIRGGTDGAQLSLRGLPCPNLFSGAINCHGPHEFVSIQVMESAARVIINICRLAAQFND